MKLVDVQIGNFQLSGVKAPDSWSDRAVGIAAKLYFGPGEKSIVQMVERVVDGIFKHEEDETDKVQLRSLLLDQRAAFNSPVWMNIGIPDRDQQAWACLILGVEDSMPSLEQGWLVESRTFQLGSGSGVNVSKIRANGEPLRDGTGVGSGPISLWMRTTDAIAGVVRSGGRTRRAAKMVIMNVDHPEIMDFIKLKAKAEEMSRRLQSSGFDIELNGVDSGFVPYQNANNSVRVSDDWMGKTYTDESFQTVLRVTGKVHAEHSAKETMQAIAAAAWECGDPGMQFDDTINQMNPVLDTARIDASNPCSEYMFVDNTVCNLASINLLKYFDLETGRFRDRLLAQDVQTMIRAMDKLVDVSSYPTPLIEETSKKYRTLGLGYTNLGALLMSLGVAYDSEDGRCIAASLMAFIQAHAILTSQSLSDRYGAYPAWPENKSSQAKVIRKHQVAVEHLPKSSLPLASAVRSFAERAWSLVDPTRALRNAQLSVIAPTGTISFIMDCETTGIEPVIAIEAEKTLVGGGTLNISIADCVKLGTSRLRRHLVRDGEGYSDKEVMEHFSDVFQTALGTDPKRVVSPEAHVDMMAAVQPFVSGAISKTVNLPSSATVEDVRSIYQRAWEKKCKSIAVYRDTSKAYQPVSPSKPEALVESELFEHIAPIRRRPPGTRAGFTHKFSIGGDEFYLTANFYEDGKLCEAFIQNNKHGSAIAGWVAVASIAVSLGLQYGVPVEDFIRHFRHMAFEPAGIVQSDSPINMATSPIDYIMRWLEANQQLLMQPVPLQSSATKEEVKYDGHDKVGRLCWNCNSPHTRWAGSCIVCEDCGETSGCS